MAKKQIKFIERRGRPKTGRTGRNRMYYVSDEAQKKLLETSVKLNTTMSSIVNELLITYL